MSSTYLDHKDVRDAVRQHLEDRKFDPRLFERGGVFFDDKKPLDESCYQEVKDCHLLVMLIGGRYGSPTSDSSLGRSYKSVTQKELETALEAGIPVLIFVRKEVQIEYRTWSANDREQRKTMRFTSVDSAAVFELLSSIYKLPRTPYVHGFERPSEIIEVLDQHLGGLISQALGEHRAKEKAAPVRVNGLKLFYHMREAGYSPKKLAERANVRKEQIYRLLKVRLVPMSETSFRETSPDVLARLEGALSAQGQLGAGRDDDFLTKFVVYHDLYRRKPLNVRRREHGPIVPARAVVLDFDGTMTRRAEGDRTTWERLWVAAGYTVNDCSELARKFIKDGKVAVASHAQWCDETCAILRRGGLRRDHVLRIASEIQLIDGVADVLTELHAKGVRLYIVSGSIQEIIQAVLGPLYGLFTDVSANHLSFGPDGSLLAIHGTRFDFQGKAHYLRNVLAQQHLSPTEVIFIGNSHNDVWASQAGVRTLCVNPHFTDGTDQREWTHMIRELGNFREVLRYIEPRGGK